MADKLLEIQTEHQSEIVIEEQTEEQKEVQTKEPSEKGDEVRIRCLVVIFSDRVSDIQETALKETLSKVHAMKFCKMSAEEFWEMYTVFEKGTEHDF